MRIHPGGFRLVLAGPKVSRLLPFLEQRGFVGDAYASGAQALAHLRRSPCHVLIIELELGDMMGVDLARTGKTEGTVGATLLMEDPIKSGMVVSALARGIEAFVPVPPDETMFIDKLETLLLAQWGIAVTAQQQQLTEELARVRGLVDAAQEEAAEAKAALEERRRTASRELSEERKKVQELVREIASLRDQLTTMHLVTGAKTGISDEGRPTRSSEGPGTSEFDDFENIATVAVDVPARAAPDAVTLQTRSPGSAPPSMQTPSIDDFDFENEATPAGGAAAPVVPAGQRFGSNDEDTAPGGHALPSQLSQQAPKKKSAQTAANLDVDMLKDLARIPTAAEEEVLFVEDD